MKRALQRGLSLLEVVLALAILGGSLAIIGELYDLGARQAAKARDVTAAQMICETKLAEITSGAVAAEAVERAVADEEGDWLYTVAVEPVDELGLMSVSVMVEQDQTLTSRPVRVTLVRWMVDPEVTAAAEAQALAEAASLAAAREVEKQQPQGLADPTNTGSGNPTAGVGDNTNNSNNGTGGQNKPGGRGSDGRGRGNNDPEDPNTQDPNGGGRGGRRGGSQGDGDGQGGGRGGGQNGLPGSEGGRGLLPPGINPRSLPNGQLPQLPPGFKLPPGFQLPPGVQLPPGGLPGNLPGNLPNFPRGGGQGGGGPGGGRSGGGNFGGGGAGGAGGFRGGGNGS